VSVDFERFFNLGVDLPNSTAREMLSDAFVPFGDDVEYRIKPTEWYRKYLKELQQNDKGKFILIRKTIMKDPALKKSNVLHKFVYLVAYLWGGDVYPLKMRNLLREIHVNPRIIKKEPTRCFKYLKKCLTHTARVHPYLLVGVEFKNNDTGQRYFVDLSNEETLESFEGESNTYAKFKKNVLAPIGVEDIRDCSIGFYQKKNWEKERAAFSLPVGNQVGNPEAFFEQIVKWCDDRIPYSEVRWTEESTRSFYRRAINGLGVPELSLYFKRELERQKPSPFHLGKVVGEALTKKNMEQKESKRSEENESNVNGEFSSAKHISQLIR